MSPTTCDADLELLAATALRHARTLAPRTSVHLSAAIDALTDPLVPPQLSGVDPANTTDPREVLRDVRDRLQRRARLSPDPRQTLAMALAARELTGALATLSGAAQPDRPGQ